jgi:hypothetical protein
MVRVIPMYSMNVTVTNNNALHIAIACGNKCYQEIELCLKGRLPFDLLTKLRRKVTSWLLRSRSHSRDPDPDPIVRIPHAPCPGSISLCVEAEKGLGYYYSSTRPVSLLFYLSFPNYI